LKLQVPHGFTNASGSYRLQAWAAMLGLLVFLIIYLGLAFWFSYTVYRLVIGIFAGGDGAVACFFSMIPPLFLAVFMWKALFSLGEKSSDPGVEVFEKDQPKLCAYINELADEIGAPRPYRIFLAPNVTAAVFYDLSFWNLIFPSKKNLIIGLGLVNALNRSEFRAVLAHEFGHFAQRSMAVGRWVYVGQQIAGSIIAKRDFLDRGLAYLSSHDLRIAWIGWIMQMVVWSIRSLMETLFGWVIRAQRALSRAMEFQADRVAVATTGSDAIVNALYRLQSAERHWDLSLLFAQRQCSEGHIAPDLYDVQTRIGEHMQRIIPDESGVNPSIPVGNPAAHRIFTEQLAQPPTMWATHPSNIAREENAKEVYIPAPIDSESPWTLFEELKTTRESVTKFVLRS